MVNHGVSQLEKLQPNGAKQIKLAGRVDGFSQ